MRHQDKNTLSPRIALQRMHGATLAELLIALLLVSVTLLSGVRAANEANYMLTDTPYYQRASRIMADLDELHALNAENFLQATDTLLANNYTTTCTAGGNCLNQSLTQLARLYAEAQRILPAGDFTLHRPDPTQTAAVRASIRWHTHDGQAIEIRWQPGG